jgi:exonuclease-1
VRERGEGKGEGAAATMGIQGLLPQLKSIMAPISAEELRGQTVAVDTYSWLHKGALSCGDRLCKGIPTTRFPFRCPLCWTHFRPIL